MAVPSPQVKSRGKGLDTMHHIIEQDGEFVRMHDQEDADLAKERHDIAGPGEIPYFWELCSGGAWYMLYVHPTHTMEHIEDAKRFIRSRFDCVDIAISTLYDPVTCKPLAEVCTP
jgi:hypothetical protein